MIAPRGRQAVDISAAFSGIATIVVLLRLYTRFCIIRSAGIEDYLISLSMLCSIGLTICIGIQARFGMGKHIKEITEPSDITNSLKAFWASLIVYYLSLWLTKSSILLQYRRVFPTKTFQIACWSVMGVVAVYGIWTIFGSIFACVPVPAFWARDTSARCIDQFVMWFFNAAMNILTDLAVILLPMPVIRNLNLKKRQKQLLMGVFAIGGLVCIVSILRLQSLVAISNSNDKTYDNPPAATWSSVEANIGIICSCLPCLRPMMARMVPSVFSSYRHGLSTAQPYGRSAYSRHTTNPDIVLSRVDAKHSRGSSSDVENGEIQVTTEVRVSVENEFDDKMGTTSRAKELRVDRESSTETLVRNVKHAI